MGGDASANDASDQHGTPRNEKRGPTKLASFGDALSVSECFDRTARYAADPTSYLRTVLGSEAFEQRRHLLCLAEQVDKDIYGNGKYRTQFVQHIAALLGKESGLFFVTGIQAQMAALKVHCDNAGNNRVAWHVTSHLEFAEESAFDKLYGFDRRLLGHDERRNPTVDEIKEVLSLPQSERPAAIVLEVPNRVLGCETYQFSDLEAISAACHAADVKFHCDGARIWEIEPFYQQTAGKTVADVLALFDSVYVSFYKGLHGVAGAILAGPQQLIDAAMVWQKRAGGVVVTLMYEVVDDARGFNENIGTFSKKWEKMSEVQEQVLAATAKFETTEGDRIVRFAVQPATCCQVKTMFHGFSTKELNAARDKVEEKLNVRVFEHTGPEKSIAQMREWLSVKKKSDAETNGSSDESAPLPHSCEWMISSTTMKLPTTLFVDAYVALCEELLAARK